MREPFGGKDKARGPEGDKDKVKVKPDKPDSPERLNKPDMSLRTKGEMMGNRVNLGVLAIVLVVGMAYAGKSKIELVPVYEKTFDSNIKNFRLRDGQPYFVITDKTINWLDKQGQVGVTMENKSQWNQKLMEAGFHNGQDSIPQVYYFISENGAYLVELTFWHVKDYGYYRAVLRLYNSSGKLIRGFEIEPRPWVLINNDGSLIAAWGYPLGGWDLPPSISDLFLYDSTGRLLKHLPEKRSKYYFNGHLLIEFFEDNKILVAGVYLEHLKRPLKSGFRYFLLNEKGQEILSHKVREREQGLGDYTGHQPTAFSRDEERFIVTLGHGIYFYDLNGKFLKDYQAKRYIQGISLAKRGSYGLFYTNEVVYLFDVKDCEVIWKRETAGSIWSTQIDDGGKYIALEVREKSRKKRYIILYDVEGNELWQSEFGYGPSFQMKLEPERKLIVSFKNRLVIYQIKDRGMR